MKILVAHNVSPDRNGGMSRLMGFIHDEISREGHSVSYFCNDRVPAWATSLVARFLFPLLVLKEVREARRKGTPYDIVNIHEPVAGLFVLLRRLGGNPAVVVTSHGLEIKAWNLDKEEARLGRRPLPWRSRLSRPLTILWPASFALKHADHIICSNDEDKEILRTRWKRAASDVTPMHACTSEIFFLKAKGRRYDRAAHLLLAGTWRYQKGTADMAAAFQRLAAEDRSLRLTISGTGLPEETVLADFSPALHDRIRVIPRLPETEAAAEFAQADIFILPSLFEGTPLTLIEAMMSGLPIVTTNTCGMKDVIQHGRNGLLVSVRSPEEIAQRVRSLLEDRDLRERLGRTATEDAIRLYTREQIALPVKKAYQGLVPPAKR